MKVLFEYSEYDTSALEECLNESFFVPASKFCKSIVVGVGYYYNSNINDAVIILPKVFIDENGNAFWKYKPEDIFSPTEDIKAELKKDGTGKILLEI